MGERAAVSAEETLVRYDNPVLVTKKPEPVVSTIKTYSSTTIMKRFRCIQAPYYFIASTKLNYRFHRVLVHQYNHVYRRKPSGRQRRFSMLFYLPKNGKKTVKYGRKK